MKETRRFPRPWIVREHAECFIVEDANSTAISYTHFIDEKTLGTKPQGVSTNMMQGTSLCS